MIIKTKKLGVVRMLDRELSDEALVFEYGFAETDSKTGEAFLKAHPKDLSKSTAKEAQAARDAGEKAAAEAEEMTTDAEDDSEANDDREE